VPPVRAQACNRAGGGPRKKRPLANDYYLKKNLIIYVQGTNCTVKYLMSSLPAM